jgi:poly-gamma-glutamate capsule biosynthesis protein CapA/YwtB (metallophosphatase superfamily)
MSRFYLLGFLVFGMLTGCGSGSEGTTDEGSTPSFNDVFNEYEQTFQDNFFAQPISLTGGVLSSDNAPISSAELTVTDEVQGSSVVTTTDENGRFSLTNLQRHNVSLNVTAEGYLPETVIVNLNRVEATQKVNLPNIILAPAGSINRMIFGGDVAFGRRFLDPDETTPVNQVPADHPEALIQASDPEPGTREALQWIKPHYEAADFSVVNLESPVTAQPTTPHPEKSFVFFTLPDSIKGLDWLGVDYVSLGNNHVYDYLEQGLATTLSNLDSYEMAHSGAGISNAEAFAPYQTVLGGTAYGLISATSVSGDRYGINYVASDSKGGAADLRESAILQSVIEQQRTAGSVPVIQLHTGKEYTFEPSAYALSRLNEAAEFGAALVVAHHPHVAQGVGRHNGVYQLHGLGNLAFDQARLETMLGQIGRVDMQADQVSQIRMIPVYLKDYRPRLIGGELADRFLRRIGEFSSNYGIHLAPYNGQGWALDQNGSVQHKTREIAQTLTIPDSGELIVDLRQVSDSSESLLSVQFSGDSKLAIGRDILLFGDMEDWDSDATAVEASRWDTSRSSSSVCLSEQYRGVSALCSVRTSDNISDSVISFKNRVRVMGDADDEPNKQLSLFGYVKGQNAGQLSLISRYYASAGSKTFGEEVAISVDPGTYEWQAVSANLNMPPEVPVEEGENPGEQNARALRLFFRQSPPESNGGIVSYDDFAVINWEEELLSGTELVTPHARDWLKITGQAGSQIELQLQFEQFNPGL